MRHIRWKEEPTDCVACIKAVKSEKLLDFTVQTLEVNSNIINLNSGSEFINLHDDITCDINNTIQTCVGMRNGVDSPIKKQLKI